MKTTYEIKDFNNREVDFKDAPFDVDDKSRRVKVALNKVGVKDHDDDIIERGAFDRTIRERGPKGKALIWHLTDHYPSLKNAVGKFSELFMEGDYLVGLTTIPNTQWGNDVLEFYKTGAINQHSIGFRTVKREIVNEDSDDRYCILKEIMLYEGSAVLWGANEQTPTLSVGKSLSRDEAVSEYAKALDELGRMNKMFKLGHLSDESYELIDMRIAQLSSKLQQLFDDATQPANEAAGSQPAGQAVDQSEGLLDALKTFNNSLKTTHSHGNNERNPKAA
jgi:HK97 family phage prohead protease